MARSIPLAGIQARFPSEWVLLEAPTRQIPGSGNTQPHGSLVRIKTPHLSQQALFASCGHRRIDSLHGLG